MAHYTEEVERGLQLILASASVEAIDIEERGETANARAMIRAMNWIESQRYNVRRRQAKRRANNGTA